MTPTQLIEFDNIQFRHKLARSRGAVANDLLLDGFNLSVAAGEFCALLGPSGCGKTTLLSLAAGLLSAEGGTVRFAGEIVSGANTKLSYMTQTDTLMPWQTMRKNIALPLKIRKMGSQQITELVESAAESLGLSDGLDKYPAELSGGMRRRTLLARCLVTDPVALLMDEPFAAVDAQLRARLQQELRENLERTGKTVFFVTHDVSESLLLADRVVTLGGRPLQIIDDFTVPFPSKNRDLKSLRLDPEMTIHEERLWGALDEAGRFARGEAGRESTHWEETK